MDQLAVFAVYVSSLIDKNYLSITYSLCSSDEIKLLQTIYTCLCKFLTADNLRNLALCNDKVMCKLAIHIPQCVDIIRRTS